MGSRVAVVALLASAVVLFSEHDARAENEGYYLGGAGVAAGLVSLPFLVADTVYTVQYQWLPPGWAIPQIVIGGGVNALLAVDGISLCNRDHPAFPGGESAYHCDRILPLVIGTAVLSVGFIAHGVASLVLYEPPPATKASGGIGLKSDGAYLRWVPDIVVTRDGKTFVALSGVF